MLPLCSYGMWDCLRFSGVFCGVVEVLCCLYLDFEAVMGSCVEGSLTISRQNDIATMSLYRSVDIVCLPNDFATNFMKYFNVEKEQF